MKVGSKIREFGTSKYGSIKLFSEAMEMHPSNLQAYLRDERSPGAAILIKLKKLGCSLDWLFEEKEVEASNELPPVESADKLLIDQLRVENKKLRAEIKRLANLIGG
jgi:transcriptional regulator with XRE-family HTH domain